MIDPKLIGLWDAGAAPVEISATGELFTVGTPWPYTLSADGQTLSFPGTNPLWQFTRLSGNAAALVGLWERFEPDTGGTWREEWLYRTDGSYTYHWSFDGEFDSEGIGSYVDDGTTIATKERRAQVSTGPGDQIVIAQFFGPVEAGTYSVAADDTAWVFAGPNGDVDFTRLP